VFRILSVSEPRVRYCHPTGETNLSIDDDGTPMISPMQSSQFAELHRSKSLDSAAGPFEVRKRAKTSLLRTEVIQQHANGNIPSACPYEGLEHLLADFAVGPNVHAEVDRLFCAVDGFDQRREEFIAIIEDRDGASVFDWRVDKMRKAG